ncbi:hypothetical protein E2C01_065944 [Portunus trituberculatus]|uniref:Uncharacterized protein n=1 Tax=Portunus trituberculatus TaxID=210409 RepID=A0A5B7HGY6_PORTR|nr:hypothetical protein [Portunus trituberculatus]
MREMTDKRTELQNIEDEVSSGEESGDESAPTPATFTTLPAPSPSSPIPSTSRAANVVELRDVPLQTILSLKKF